MKLFPLFAVLLFTALPVSAEQMQYGMINLSASAETEVSNDELSVQLQVFEQGEQTAKLSDLVNTKTALVLDALKNFPDISAKTSNYNTRPIYDNGKIKAWQVTQTISLKTADFAQMSKLIGDINSMAQIQSMQFGVSKAKTDEAKQSLIKQAINDFKTKAQLVANEFDESGYDLVSLSVDSGYQTPRPMMSQMMMADEASAKRGIPAALQGGSNTVSVTVSGTIQLTTPSR